MLREGYLSGSEQLLTSSVVEFVNEIKGLAYERGYNGGYRAKVRGSSTRSIM